MPSNRGKINRYLIYIIDWWLDPIEIISEKSPLFSIKSMKNTLLCLLFHQTEYFCLYKLLYFTSLLITKNKDYLLQNMAASVRFFTMRMLSLFLLSFFHLRACHSSPSMQPLCHDEESQALLQLKESLVINESASSDPSAYPKVASWKVNGENGDCCSWDGVECDGDSGHVIGLDLSSSCLYGSIDSNSSLFHLVQLRRLNLADNDFNNSKIPSGIRNLSRLVYLNLTMDGFSVGLLPLHVQQMVGTNHWLLAATIFNG